ncbi:hypothetical protein [Achromobacter sp. DH1f]|uniref:hypothetical protein n=1 Tax=Achromobacter sp. DH1f TaxID=1397275 RepID=UPI00046ACE68|nr:hypothetical protein [Achromobacter sp. DH1f]
MHAKTDEITFRELSAWIGAADAPASVAINFDASDRRGAESTVSVRATRELLAAWARLLFGMETLGLLYAESRLDTGLTDPNGILVLSRSEQDDSLHIGWETAQGTQVAPTPVDRILQGLAEACRGQISSINLEAGPAITEAAARDPERPRGAR